jgi:hypothetical protein
VQQIVMMAFHPDLVTRLAPQPADEAHRQFRSYHN